MTRARASSVLHAANETQGADAVPVRAHVRHEARSARARSAIDPFSQGRVDAASPVKPRDMLVLEERQLMASKR